MKSWPIATSSVDCSEHRGAELHIGIFKFNHIGDVLLLTPLLRTLRRHFPDARIAVMVNDDTAAALHGNPDLDRLLVYPRAHIKSKPKWQQLLLEFRLAMKIRHLALDMAFTLTNGDRGLLYAWFSRAAIRTGFAKRQWKPFSWRKKALTHGMTPDIGDHQVIRQLKLLEKVGIPFDLNERMRLEISPEDADWATKHGREVGSWARMIVVHPVAKRLLKCWEPGKFARLIDWLQEEVEIQVVVTCGQASQEREYAKEMLALCRTRPNSFLGNIAFGQLAAIIAQCDLFIGIDTAPMHMAAALDRPVVALFGPTSRYWIPWCRHFAVIRGKCLCNTKRRIGHERFSDGLADRIGLFVLEGTDDGVRRFTLDQRYQGTTMAFAAHRVAFPVTKTAFSVNDSRALIHRHPLWNPVSLLLGKLRVTHPCSSYFGRYEKATMLLRLASLPTL